ncbi:MAG: L,D-transpeptidase family protein [Desulfobacteraceae bacterium]|nr:L,D-transpeptidase family protein [Desulfobacteraceae bacterium]
MGKTQEMKKIIMFKVLFTIYTLFAVLLLPAGSGSCSSLPVADNLLPKSIISLPENANAILVEKQTQMLYVYSLKHKQLDLVFSAPCSTGEISGSKKKVGDKKTPEGVYFLTDEYKDRYLTPIYGKKAFPSDYPNFYDLRLGKEGSAIWIHGTNKVLKPRDSNGCIALDNNNILSLSDYIQLNFTPLIIVEKNLKTDIKSQAGREKKVLKLLGDWTHSIETGGYHQYLGFYSEEYVPDITWWETWLKLRKKSTRDKVFLKVETANTGIYVQNNIVVVLFDLILSSGKEKVLIGKRELFLEKSSHEYKIVGDIIQKKSKVYKTIDSPLITAAQKLLNYTIGEVSAVETVRKWLIAWSSKKMDAYAGFYADDFYSDGLGKKAWVNRKKQLSRKYNYITVTGKDFKMTKKKDSCEVSFFQNYESSNFSTQGTKHLKLVRKGGLWKISQENWKKK